MAQYPYQPLNLPLETRCLLIAQGEWDDQIECCIVNVALDDDSRDEMPPFDALSYCWIQSVTAQPPSPDTIVWAGLYDSTGERSESAKPMRFEDMRDNANYKHMYYGQGGPRLPETIICDGRQLFISGELHCALRYLRWRTDMREYLSLPQPFIYGNL